MSTQKGKLSTKSTAQRPVTASRRSSPREAKHGGRSAAKAAVGPRGQQVASKGPYRRGTPLPGHLPDFETMRVEARLTVEALAQWLGVDKSTVMRWRRPGCKAPVWAVRLLALKSGRLDEVGLTGWRFMEGRFVGPDLPKQGISPADIFASYWLGQAWRERAQG